MRAQIWAYTPATGSWSASIFTDGRRPINGHVVRLARDAGYRSMAVYTDSKGVTALYIGTSGLRRPCLPPAQRRRAHFQTVGPTGFNSGR